MAPTILIAGGYGLVGGHIARMLRAVSGEARIVLAGRNPGSGTALAGEIAATASHLDVADRAGASRLVAEADLVIATLYDPANALFEAALQHSVAHIGITSKAEDMAPLACAVLRTPPRRPMVVLGHCTAGVATLAGLKAARSFERVDALHITALFDPRDTVGAMTAGDAEMLVSRALLRREGRWMWVDGRQHGRSVELPCGPTEGYPAGLLDVPSLAAATGAADVRIDMAQGQSQGTLAGRPGSSDIFIDLAGILKSGRRGTCRVVVSDPAGLAHLTAVGVLAAAVRVLGLDGAAPATAGLHLPETLLEPDAALARFEQFGVRITSETGDAS